MKRKIEKVCLVRAPCLELDQPDMVLLRLETLVSQAFFGQWALVLAPVEPFANTGTHLRFNFVNEFVLEVGKRQLGA